MRAFLGGSAGTGSLYNEGGWLAGVLAAFGGRDIHLGKNGQRAWQT